MGMLTIAQAPKPDRAAAWRATRCGVGRRTGRRRGSGACRGAVGGRRGGAIGGAVGGHRGGVSGGAGLLHAGSQS